MESQSDSTFSLGRLSGSRGDQSITGITFSHITLNWTYVNESSQSYKLSLSMGYPLISANIAVAIAVGTPQVLEAAPSCATNSTGSGPV